MQFLSGLTADQRRFARETSAGKRLPYARLVDDRTIETRDGLLMQVIQLGGLLFETADTDELNYRKLLRDATLQAIGSSRFALYHHVIRRRVTPDTAAEFPDQFCTELDATWRARLADKKLFANELFLTIVRRPLQGRGGAADRVARLLGRGTGATQAASQLATRRCGRLSSLSSGKLWARHGRARTGRRGRAVFCRDCVG